MTLLDAYALLAFLLDAGAAEDVEPLLREDDRAIISALNLAEVVDQLIRVTDRPEGQVLEQIEPLLDVGLSVAPVTGPIGTRAGLLRARHYRKRGAGVSMADCVACATATTLRLPLATADPALAVMARAEGVEVIPLPDSEGRRP